MLPRFSALALAVVVLLCKMAAFHIALLYTWDLLTRLAAASSLCIHVIHQENG